MKSKNAEFEISQIRTSLPQFLSSYNQTIPANFPRATVAILNKFQIAHPLLFKHGDEWSIAKHRKKLMDWISSHHNVV